MSTHQVKVVIVGAGGAGSTGSGGGGGGFIYDATHAVNRGAYSIVVGSGNSTFDNLTALKGADGVIVSNVGNNGGCGSGGASFLNNTTKIGGTGSQGGNGGSGVGRPSNSLYWGAGGGGGAGYAGGGAGGTGVCRIYFKVDGSDGVSTSSTGGTIYNNGDIQFHLFTSNGTFTVVYTTASVIDTLYAVGTFFGITGTYQRYWTNQNKNSSTWTDQNKNA